MLGFPIRKVVTSMTLRAWETLGRSGVCCRVVLCGGVTTDGVGAEALRILEGPFQTGASLCCSRAACSDGHQLFLTHLHVRRGSVTELQGGFLLTAFRYDTEGSILLKSRNTINLID